MDEVATRRTDRGAVLVVVLVVLVALSGLAAAIVPLTTTEIAISADHRRAVQMHYAAESAVEYAIQELGMVADWHAALQGRLTSQRGASGAVRLADGTVVDLASGNPATTGRVPLFNRDPSRLRWQLFLHAPFDQLTDHATEGVLHVVVWIADDGGERDGDPLIDTNGTVVLHAACFGPAGAQRAVRVTARRRADGWVEAVSWESFPARRLD